MKLTLARIIILAVLLFNLGSEKLCGQEQKGLLAVESTKTATIGPTEIHHYQLNLDENQFAFLRLVQDGVDLKVRTIDPDGKPIADFDSPNGRSGPELIALDSTIKGTYVIEVSPFDGNEPQGKYELRIEHLKAAPDTLAEKVDTAFLPWDSDKTPGVAVAVVKDGVLVFKNGYGIANLEYDVPIGPSTVFHIASVSKQFTVFSVLLLEDEGKLSLDDDIRKFIPEVPDFGKTITLRHLASHTSGLRDQWALLGMAGWRSDDVITKEHILKIVAKQKALNFAPGEEYSYCNTGFTLLAEVVARVSKMSFAEFTHQRIFEPLKMSNTLFYDDHEKIVKNRAYSYHHQGHLKKSLLNFANVGATSLFTSAEDLAQWAMNFPEPKVGNQAIIDKMNTLAVLNNGRNFGGALGQFVGTYKGLKEIQHGGGDAGYRSFLTRFPEQDLAVVVLSNSAEFDPGAMAHKVVDIFLQDDLIDAPKKPATQASTEPATNGETSFDSSSVKLEEYSGRYYSEELSTEYRLLVEDGKLVARHSRLSDMRLRPTQKDGFDGFFGSIKFTRDANDSINGFSVTGGRVRNVLFEKLK